MPKNIHKEEDENLRKEAERLRLEQERLIQEIYGGAGPRVEIALQVLKEVIVKVYNNESNHHK